MNSSKIFSAFFLLSLLISTFAWAQPPVNYYASLNGLKKQELKEQLGKILKNHTVRSYDDLRTDYKSIYVVKGTTNQVYDLFCPDAYTYNQSRWNREHVVPNSYWGGTRNAAYSDLINVIPSDATANNRKSNYPIGVVGGTVSYDNGCIKVGKPVTGQGGGHSYVFEPCDQYKGDFARIYLYVATCYDNINWDNTAKSTFTKEAYPTLSSWLVELMLKWNRQDPPSEDEIRINNAIYPIQNNRNPFIDYPALADYIWGARKDVALNLDSIQLYQNVIDTTTIVPDPPTPDTTTVTPPVTPGKYDHEWVYVTSHNELTENTQVVIASTDYGYVAANMTTTAYLPYKAATFSSDKQYITSLPDDALVLTLEKADNGNWKLKNTEGNYLAATAAKKMSWTGAANTWNIQITNGTTIITNSVSNYGTIQYNAGSPRFLNYTSSQKPIQLFRKVPLLQTGDVNGDGIINVTDLTILVNYIMENNLETSSPTFKLADINQDGVINVSDITELVNLIMQ